MAAFTAIAATAITVGTSVAGAVSKKKAGKAAAESAEFNAFTEELNAQQADKETAIALQQQRRQAYKIYGNAQAAAGASGIQQSGSVLDVLAESARNAQEDASTISTRGAFEASQYRRQATTIRMGGEQAKKEATAGMVSDLVGGVAGGINAYNKYSGPSSSSMSNNSLIRSAPYRSTGLV